MKISFAWDPDKAARNAAKHGVPFAEAATVFADPLVRIAPGAGPPGEDRWTATGSSIRRRLLVVVFTEERHATRIISARTATPRERRTHGR